jgi:SAM-dependent methyltransferase
MLFAFVTQVVCSAIRSFVDKALETPVSSHQAGAAEDPRIPFFDRLAREWDGSEQSPEETVGEVDRRAAWLGLHAGENVLEVGCGTGQLTGWLVERVRPGRVTGVDFSPEMLQVAASKGIDAAFHLADVCRDELGSSEFDAALCFHSFPHFRNPQEALRNIARCLKPQGRLLVLHLHRRDDVNAYHHGVGGIVAGDILPDNDRWQTWLASAGFEPPKITDGDEGFFLQASLRRS